MANTIADSGALSQAMSAMYRQEVPQYGTLLGWWLTSTWRYWKIIRSCMNSSLTLTSWRASAWSATRDSRGHSGRTSDAFRRMFVSWECIPLAITISRRPACRSTPQRFVPSTMPRWPLIHFGFSPRCCAPELIENRAPCASGRSDPRAAQNLHPRCLALIAQYEAGDVHLCRRAQVCPGGFGATRWHRQATVDGGYHALHREHPPDYRCRSVSRVSYQPLAADTGY